MLGVRAATAGTQPLITPRFENRPLSRWKPTPIMIPEKTFRLTPPMRVCM